MYWQLSVAEGKSLCYLWPLLFFCQLETVSKFFEKHQVNDDINRKYTAMVKNLQAGE